MWEAKRKSAFPLPKQKTIQNRKPCVAVLGRTLLDITVGDWRSLNPPPKACLTPTSRRGGESKKLCPMALHTSNRKARETKGAGSYRTTARGLKNWLGLPARPRGSSGWLRLTGPKALLSGQQGPSWGGRPLNPTEWSAVGGSHALRQREGDRF